MPSYTLLGQSLLSGIFIGALYGLMGLGLGLSWGYLKLINLAHFALVFLGAYLVYQFAGLMGFHPVVALLAVMPAFFLLGVAMQALFQRFQVNEFGSLLVTFGLTIITEALIQYFWTADFRQLQLSSVHGSWRVGPFYIPPIEAAMLVTSVALAVATWAWLRFSYLGKAVRACAENPDMATAFGIDTKKLAYLISGLGAVYAAVAGAFVATIFTLFPAQIFTKMGVIFAVVILGGLGNPLGVLAAGLTIGISEAITMAVTEPAWAPLVSFTLLILVLVFRPGRL
jgi:branched-chain amino acid transport system permease protein